MEDAYFDFFDHRAFSDGSPYYPCYCSGFNMRKDEIHHLQDHAKPQRNAEESWRNILRICAVQMVRQGKIKGYLAFDRDKAIAWCNANDRLTYFRTGEFDVDHMPEDEKPDVSLKQGQIKSVVCFAISPEYRHRGIASKLLERVCLDAKNEGYEFVEAYPRLAYSDEPAFTGPLRLYEKAGFKEYARNASGMTMRKALL